MYISSMILPSFWYLNSNKSGLFSYPSIATSHMVLLLYSSKWGSGSNFIFFIFLFNDIYETFIFVLPRGFYGTRKFLIYRLFGYFVVLGIEVSKLQIYQKPSIYRDSSTCPSAPLSCYQPSRSTKFSALVATMQQE